MRQPINKVIVFTQQSDLSALRSELLSRGIEITLPRSSAFHGIIEYEMNNNNTTFIVSDNRPDKFKILAYIEKYAILNNFINRTFLATEDTLYEVSTASSEATLKIVGLNEIFDNHLTKHSTPKVNEMPKPAILIFDYKANNTTLVDKVKQLNPNKYIVGLFGNIESLSTIESIVDNLVDRQSDISCYIVSNHPQFTSIVNIVWGFSAAVNIRTYCIADNEVVAAIDQDGQLIDNILSENFKPEWEDQPIPAGKVTMLKQMIDRVKRGINKLPTSVYELKKANPKIASKPLNIDEDGPAPTLATTDTTEDTDEHQHLHTIAEPKSERKITDKCVEWTWVSEPGISPSLKDNQSGVGMVEASSPSIEKPGKLIIDTRLMSFGQALSLAIDNDLPIRNVNWPVSDFISLSAGSEITPKQFWSKHNKAKALERGKKSLTKVNPSLTKNDASGVTMGWLPTNEDIFAQWEFAGVYNLPDKITIDPLTGDVNIKAQRMISKQPGQASHIFAGPLWLYIDEQYNGTFDRNTIIITESPNNRGIISRLIYACVKLINNPTLSSYTLTLKEACNHSVLMREMDLETFLAASQTADTTFKGMKFIIDSNSYSHDDVHQMVEIISEDDGFVICLDLNEILA